MVGKGVKKEATTPRREPTRTYRKSPARTETRKSPSRSTVKTISVSPTPRPALRKKSTDNTPNNIARKSPTRSPARRGRKPKSASPSRNNDIIVPEKPESKAQNLVFELESASEDSDTIYNTKLISEKPKRTLRERINKVNSETSLLKDTTTWDMPPVQSRIESDIRVTRRSLSRSQTKEIDHIDRIKRESIISSIQKLTELSDDDDLKGTAKEKSERRSMSRLTDKKEIVAESGWLIPLLATCILPLIPILYYMFCNEVQCQITKLPNLSKFKNFGTYFDGMSWAITSGFGLLVVITSALPFGGFKISGLPNKQGKLEYVMNGMLVAISATLALAILEFYNVPVIENVIKKYFQLLISMLILAFFVSVWLYIRSFYTPLCTLKSDVLASSRIYNFLNGRELNPRLFGVVDIKLCLLRFCLVGSILLNGILLYKDISIGKHKEGGLDLKSTQFNPTLLVAAITQIIYLADSLVFESHYVSTSTVQYDAVGYQTVTTFTYGILFMYAGPRYIYDHGVKLPLWHLMLVSTLFCVGYFLYRASNAQKHTFRQNPYHPSISHLETLPTSQGKKLLVSGYWGWVRHPNYLGDVLITLSFALTVYNALPAAIYVLTILLLFQRAHEDGVRCKQRYGSAWERYCQRVKYVMIPKIY